MTSPHVLIIGAGMGGLAQQLKKNSISSTTFERDTFGPGVITDDTLKVFRANRRRMREWLMQGVDVRFNKRLLRVEEHGDKVTAYSEGGTSGTVDFWVGAEGTRSAVRRQYFLKGQDVMKPLPMGSVFGEISLSGDDFLEQLTNWSYRYFDNTSLFSTALAS